MNRRLAALAASLLVASGTGCTTMMLEKQGKPKAEHASVCPVVYAMTRLDVAALDWAFAADPRPADPCLALYYPKAAQDTLYQTSTRYLSPLMMLSLPLDVVLDTLVLPISLSRAD